ncbi:MAG: MucR family transcriptional regulator [Deltaproteobacteria bacterium]|nr:MucR family transcriptional regulator [Deltaproteobacteria bacterium]
MADLLELTADIVCAHASVTEISPNDLLNEIKAIHATLQALEKGETPGEVKITEPKKRGRKAQTPADLPAEKVEEKPAAPPAPAMTIEEAFKPDQVGCMICGKTGMKTLKRHLSTAHDLKPGKYRKQFNIPKDQPLAATEYVAKRRQAALDRGLGEKMAAARAARKKKTDPAAIMNS